MFIWISGGVCRICFHSLWLLWMSAVWVVLFWRLWPETLGFIMADLSFVDTDTVRLKPPLHRSSPEVRLNMAGRGGDVMCSWSGSGSTNCALPLVVPASEEQTPKRRRRTFCPTRTKSRGSSGERRRRRQQQSAANNNNTPFIIHCHLGKEIKHICSNCRGAEPLDGERTRIGSLQGQGLSPELVTAPCVPGPGEPYCGSPGSFTASRTKNSRTGSNDGDKIRNRLFV